MVFMAFAGADLLQAESGLFAATFMGIVMANQKTVNVRHIVEFKENLRVLVLSTLFILLAASLKMDDLLAQFNWASFGFLCVLILVARPLAVLPKNTVPEQMLTILPLCCSFIWGATARQQRNTPRTRPYGKHG